MKNRGRAVQNNALRGILRKISANYIGKIGLRRILFYT